MSSPAPTPANRYLIVNTTLLDPATLNAILTSIAERLEAQEAKAADYDGAIDALTSLGLSAISANLTPVVEQERAAVEALESRVTLAEDRVAALIASQLPADSITLAAIPDLAAATVQSAIAELMVGKASVVSVAALGGVVTDGLAAKANAATTYTKAEVDAAVAAHATSYATILKMAG